MPKKLFHPLITVLVLLFLLTTASANTLEGKSQAANMTYQGIYPGKHIHLKNGSWKGKPFQPGSASRPHVGLIKDFSFSGDLNRDGQPEQIVFLWESSGGSGTQIYMAVNAYHNGHWTNIATTHLGDRIQLQMGRVNQGAIELDVIQAGKGDAACCPTHKVLRRWTLSNGALVEDTPLSLGQISIKDLQGINWRLVKMNWKEKVPQGTEITLQFNNNKISGRGGCNRYSAAVKEGKIPGEIKFGPIAGTRMACEEEITTLENRFLNALAHTRSFSFVNGYLTLEWQDEGAVSTLFFKPVN